MSAKQHNLLGTTKITKKRISFRNSLKILEFMGMIPQKFYNNSDFALFKSGLRTIFRWLKTVRIGLKRAVSVENYDFCDR